MMSHQRGNSGSEQSMVATPLPPLSLDSSRHEGDGRKKGTVNLLSSALSLTSIEDLRKGNGSTQDSNSGDDKDGGDIDGAML